MDDNQLLRYSRQIMLPQVDVQGQQTLLNSTVMIIGLGGLGSPVAMYLAAAGVGHLVLVDYDDVDITNLQRQIVHLTKNIGQPKVFSAQETLREINPEIRITPINRKLIGTELVQDIRQADVVVDASDNFDTRFAVNQACVVTHTPLVSGAAIRMEGQVTVFNNDKDSPCYRCLYKDSGELDTSCSTNGVLAPVVGIVGSIQATETIKVLLGMGETLASRLLLLDAMRMQWRVLKMRKDPTCPVCKQ